MSHHEESKDESKTATSHSEFKKMTVVKSVSIADAMNPKFRASMEDTYIAADCLGTSRTSAFFGVFDGHGGREVAEYLRTHLHENVAKEVASKAHKNLETAMESAYLITDVKCQEELKETASGSTAVTVLIRMINKKRYIITANCGDARAVLATTTGAERLSLDHKATDTAEIQRIERAGGMVMRRRVLGVLAVARSFGDFALKKFVPSKPYTSTRVVDHLCQFVIIACDGVWDVMSDDEACKLVRTFLGGHISGTGSKSALAAQYLVEQAISKGSTDNVTALIVFL